MTRVYTLKNGKTFTGPSLFLNPQKPLDAQALWKVDNDYGLPHLDGILVNMIDYHAVYDTLALNYQPLVASEKPGLREKIKIIDPSYHVLLTGTNEQKAKMISTGFFDRNVERIIKTIANSGVSNQEKALKTVNDIYPNLRVKPALEFEIENGTDMIVCPCVPITSKRRLFSQQVDKARSMLMDSRTLLNTTFKKHGETHDLMNIVTIDKNVINERNFRMLFELLLCNEPDQVGIRLMGINNESETVFMNVLFQFLREFDLFIKLRGKKYPLPIHLINVDELGYVGYCNGAANMISPIATNPYYAFASSKKMPVDEDRDLSGRYYHPIDMNYPMLSTIDTLPCVCRECRKYLTVGRVPENERPIFRRVHWLLSKDEEIRQFRETRARLDIALRDKFARSMRTQFVAYLPTRPVFNV